MSPVDIRDYDMGSMNWNQWVTEEKRRSKVGSGEQERDVSGKSWGEECLWKYDLNMFSNVLRI